ncbi:hypothetical protein N8647_00140 [bacterium]|nr:hypothetical protein [bacterium]
MGNAETGKANKQETNTEMSQLGERAFGQTYDLTRGPYGGDIESFMEQIDWYHRQMSLRDEKKPPTQALAGIAAALYSGLGPKVEVKSVVDLAWELWKASDAKLNGELGRDEMPEIERRFKLLGVKDGSVEGLISLSKSNIKRFIASTNNQPYLLATKMGKRIKVTPVDTKSLEQLQRYIGIK